MQLKAVRWGPIQFRQLLGPTSGRIEPGAWVHVYGPDGLFAGQGWCNHRSELAVRIVTREPVDSEAGFLQRQIDRAWNLRKSLTPPPAELPEACRLINSEGDGLSGLVVDRLGPVLSIEAHSLAAWRLADQVARLLADRAGCPSACVHMDQRIAEAEGLRESPLRWIGPPREQITLREGNIRIRVRFGKDLGQHKTGYFCDQRLQRVRFGQLAAGHHVLDVCCYSGAFACHAAANHAASVTAVELDEHAVQLARENANLNQQRIAITHADAFPWMRQAHANGRLFGRIVLDPPKLIHTREETRIGTQKYIDLNKLAFQLAEPDAILCTCSCSGLLHAHDFTRLVCDAARYVGRKIQLLELCGPPPDHPVMADYPEGAYLKALWLRVL